VNDFTLTYEQYQESDQNALRALAAATAFYTGVGKIVADDSLSTSARLLKLQALYRVFACTRALRYLIYVAADHMACSRPDLDEIRTRFDEQSRDLVDVDASWADWLQDVRQTLDDCASDFDSQWIRIMMLRDHLLQGLSELIAKDPPFLLTFHDGRMFTEAGLEVPK
jgi:hypothetical protein